MKKYTLLSIFLLVSSFAFSQCAFTINANSPTYCAPATGTDVTVTVTGGLAPFTYQLNQGLPQAGNLFPNVAAGTYTVYVTDASPCTDSMVISGVVNPQPYTNITNILDVSCNGSCDGSASTTGGMGGTPPYYFGITPIATQAPPGTFSGLCAGMYIVTTTDAIGCLSTISFAITQPPILNTFVTATTPTTCIPGCDGTVSVSANGGVGLITFSIAPNVPQAPSGTFTNLCANITYTITASDANGCSGSTTVTLTGPTSPLISVNTTSPPSCIPGCDGTGTTTTTGGMPPYTYSITGGGINPIGNLTNLCGGTVYTIIVTDANSCSGTTNLYVISPPSPTFTTSILTPPSCTPGCDGIMTTNITGGTLPYNYSITGGALIDLSGTASMLCAGVIYTLTVTDANGCTQSILTPVINAAGAPVIIINTTTSPSCVPGCDGTLTTLIAGGASPYNYSISGGAFIDLLGNAAGLCAGTVYTVTVTDANLCTGTTTVQLVAPPTPIMTVTNITNPLCNGICNGTVLTTTMGGTPAYAYSISGGGSISPIGNASNLCGGMGYTIIVVDANGCSAGTTVNISQPPVLNATISSFTNPTCNGITDGTINVTASGGAGPVYNYLMYPGAVNNVTGQFTNLGQGVYTIAVSDANNCTTFTVQVLSIPSLNFTVNTINNLSCTCVGSIEITNVTGGVGPYSYAISPAVNQPLPGTFDNMCSAVYTITTTDINNCSGSTVFSFNQIQLTTSAVNSQCTGIDNGSINCSALFGTPPYTYTLNPGNVVNASGIFAGLAADTYTIDVVDANSCSNTTTIIINNNTQINVNLISTDSVICGVNGGASFAANGNAIGPYTYTVQPGNIVNVNGIFDQLSAGTYALTVNNISGCIKTSAFDIIQVSALLPVAVSSTVYDETCYLSGDGAIDIIPANPNGLTYQWNNGAVTQDLSSISSGNYEVTISNVNGDCVIVYDTVNNIGATCGTVSGNVFYDANYNCISDAGENSVVNIMLQLSNGAMAYTNMAGDYQFSNVPYGTYQLTHSANAYMMPNVCTQPANLTINAGNNNLMNMDFKDSTSTIMDAEVFTNCGGVAPGFNGSYEIYVWNNSAFPMTGDLSFTLNNNLTLNNTIPLNQGVYPVVTGDSVVWTNITIPPVSFGSYFVSFLTPAAVPLGSLIQSDANINVTNYVDNIPANNYYSLIMVTQGAFDPNDKTVNPIGEGPNGNITLQDSVLNYNIRFQNTGTDSAHNIYILDTLSDKVDLSTLKVTGFSHPYKIEILNSNILKFKFDNIMLPDSNINEPLSHGYIAYSIEQKNTNQIGDVINNTASIYFDFNAPIVTNTTINTIAFPTLLNSPEFEKTIYVYPNPAADKLTVEFNSTSNDQSSITLTNTLGQVVKTVLANPINGKNKIELSVKELPKGVYILKLIQGKNQSMKKVVIE